MILIMEPPYEIMKTKIFTPRICGIVLTILAINLNSYAGITDIKYSFLQTLPYNTAAINGSNNTNNKIPAGTRVAYKTNQGRLGIFEVTQYGNTLKLSWITYNSNRTVYSQGTNLTINGTRSADLDPGAQVSSGSTADFFWMQSTEIIRFLLPQNGAMFFVLPSAACETALNSLKTFTNTVISSYPLNSESINGSNNSNNKIPIGTRVLYQTNEGRYGIFMVAQYGYSLVLNYVTYSSTGAIHSQGCGLVIGGTANADLDNGEQSSTGKDFFWMQTTETIRTIVPKNGAKFFVLPSAACESTLNPLKVFTNDAISNYPFNSESINGSNNSNNKIPTGTRVLYQTNEGRYGIFMVAQYGYSLVLNYITYSSTGAIHSQGCGLVIGGTANADLDNGEQSSTGKDFFWMQTTETIRTIVPKNGAKFFVLPSAACEATLSPLKTFTNTTISNYPFNSEPINGSNNSNNKIPTGTRVLYQTNEGRYGIFIVAQYGYSLVLNYVTYSSTGAIYSQGCGLVIGGTANADLDNGEQSSTGQDFFWMQSTEVIRTILPKNGAKFFVLPSAACESALNPLKTFTNDAISSYPFTSESIDGSNNSNNKIPTGTRVLYQTNEGRYGIFMVAQYGYSLVLNYVTYSSTGAIHSQGCGVVIGGTANADLDDGEQSSTGHDFFWMQTTEIIRTIVPKNGAKFFVLPSASSLRVANAEDIQRIDLAEEQRFNIYPVPATDHIVIKKNDGMNPKQVRIYNASGILIKEINNPSEVIPIEELSPRLYYLQYRDGDKWRSAKFLKE
jgi:hypothetical protein